MLELIIIGVTLGLFIGAGVGLSFFACIYIADWFERRSRRPLKTDSREIVRMHGWEEGRD